MPTGYTADVQSGKVTDFSEFALDCARAFGACITMRDEPSGTPIPDAFTANTSYHDNALSAAREAMSEALDLTDGQCEERAEAEHTNAVAAHHERMAEKEQQRIRYQKMLEPAEAWVPPTEEHKKFKNFMVTQLRESIDFDCGKSYYTHPDKLTGHQWRKNQIDKANRDIEYHTEERQKEIERVSNRNEWLRALRQSLPS